MYINIQPSKDRKLIQLIPNDSLYDGVSVPDYQIGKEMDI